MFNSSYTIQNIINSVKAEVDFSPTISDDTYLRWYNSLISRLYTEIVREVHTADCAVSSGVITLPTPSGFASVRPCDVISVFFGDIPYERSNGRLSKELYSNKFFEDGSDLKIVSKGTNPTSVTVYYIARPISYPATQIGAHNVPLPDDYIQIIECYLRSEAYKVANEDTIAAKWATEYNTHLQNLIYYIANNGGRDGV